MHIYFIALNGEATVKYLDISLIQNNEPIIQNDRKYDVFVIYKFYYMTTLWKMSIYHDKLQLINSAIFYVTFLRYCV